MARARKSQLTQGGVAPGARQPEIPAHAEQKQGQGEQGADQEFPGLSADFRLTGKGFAVATLRGCVNRQGAVTGFFNGRGNAFHGQDGRIVSHADPLGGEVDRGVDHARGLFVQGPLDIGGAVGAGHAGNGQGNRAFRSWRPAFHSGEGSPDTGIRRPGN